LKPTASYWILLSGRQGVPPFSKFEYLTPLVKEISDFIDCGRWIAIDFTIDDTPSVQNNLFMDGFRGSDATIRND